MNDIEKSIIREANFDEYNQRMEKVKSNFRVFRFFSVYANIGVSLFSIAYIFIWLTYTNTGIKFALSMSEEIGIISFPGAAVTFFLAPVLTVLSFFSESFLIKKLNIISQILYSLITVFGFVNLLFGFEVMKMMDMLLLIAYGMAGFVLQDFAIRNYKELDFLSTKEGYPDFLYNLECDRHSKYVRYRNKWLEKQKKQDYYTPNERPITEYTIDPGENENSMDGISVDAEAKENWFRHSDISVSDDENTAAETYDMEHIAPEDEELLDETDYIIDDVRRKPL